jgi:hypothetical protein
LVPKILLVEWGFFFAFLIPAPVDGDFDEGLDVAERGDEGPAVDEG